MLLLVTQRKTKYSRPLSRKQSEEKNLLSRQGRGGKEAPPNLSVFCICSHSSLRKYILSFELILCEKIEPVEC